MNVLYVGDVVRWNGRPATVTAVHPHLRILTALWDAPILVRWNEVTR
jgi:hypothetical protein